MATITLRLTVVRFHDSPRAFQVCAGSQALSAPAARRAEAWRRPKRAGSTSSARAVVPLDFGLGANCGRVFGTCEIPARSISIRPGRVVSIGRRWTLGRMSGWRRRRHRSAAWPFATIRGAAMWPTRSGRTITGFRHRGGAMRPAQISSGPSVRLASISIRRTMTGLPPCRRPIQMSYISALFRRGRTN
jgi:hypothetical protein